MDNLAHTLVGAALGRAIAGRELPAAGWIGAIAGNAPDWAELVLKPSSWAPRGMIGCAAAGVVGWTRHWFGVAGRRRAAAYGPLVLGAYDPTGPRGAGPTALTPLDWAAR